MSDGSPEITGKEQGTAPERADLETRFKPGQSGNPAGRPKGARQKLERRFLLALLKDFKAEGAEAIKKTREDKPDAYLNVIAKVLPKEISGDVNLHHRTHEEALKDLE